MTRPRRRPTRIGRRTNIRRETEGWSVVIVRRGRRFPGYFGDGVYGGRERARLAAWHFRDQLFLLRVGPDTRVRRQVREGTRSTTRVVGVSLERHVVDGRVYHRYVACWQDPERGLQRRRFLVEHFGEKTAKALAIAARKAGVAHSHAVQLARQREEARRRLRKAPPMPRQVKDPRDRKGISMARRRPRRVK